MQAVDDCTTVAAIFKLLEGFEGLLEREAIAGELERKYLELLAAFSVDIRQATGSIQLAFPLLPSIPQPHDCWQDIQASVL